MPQGMVSFNGQGLAGPGNNFFRLNDASSAQVDMRLGIVLIQPQNTPFQLLGLKPSLDFGGRNYGSSGKPVGMNFPGIPNLKGPKHTWQEHTLLRNVVPVVAARVSTDTTITFSLTLPDVKNPDAYQVSTYDLYECASGELIWVTAMNYTTGVATVIRGYGYSAAANQAAQGYANANYGVAPGAIAAGEKLLRAGRIFPEGSELDLKLDTNVAGRNQDYNFSTITRTPLYLTRTALDSLYYAQQEDIREMEIQSSQHVLSLESAAMFSVRSESVTPGGLTIRSGDGVIPKMARDGALIADLVTDLGGTNFAAMTLPQWNRWLANYLFKFITADQEKYIFLTTTGLSRLHELYPIGQFERVERDPIGDFGSIVLGLTTPYGYVKVCPCQLLSDRAGRNLAAPQIHVLGINGSAFKSEFMKKTTLQREIQNPSADGKGMGYLSEMMIEFSAMPTQAALRGIA
jgi:hypothetical protein